MVEIRGVNTDMDALVQDLRPRKASGILWATPIDERLECLVNVAKANGERTNRQELAAAIVASVKPNPKTLRQMLTRYRTMTTRDALADVMPETESENVIRFERRPPRSAHVSSLETPAQRAAMCQRGEDSKLGVEQLQ